MDQEMSSVLNQGHACDYCQKRRIRCDKQKPQCIECITRNIQCNYGVRLKRGPKTKKQEITVSSETRIRKKSKSNSRVQALLFELEFNKKMVDIWKSAFLNENDNFRSAKQKCREFEPATEEFSRSPNAIQTIMTEFNETFRLIFSMPTYAAKMDFATKIWQAMIEISAADLLSMLSTFDSNLLLSMLEYYIAFMLCLKLSKYNDIAEYISVFVNYIFDTIIYSREDCPVSLEQAEKILHSLAFVGHYYKMTNNLHALTNNVFISYEIYNNGKKKWAMPKDLEARMLCRMILAAKSEEDRRAYIDSFYALDPAELPALTLFMVNISVSIESIQNKKTNLMEANVAIEKASYFAQAFVSQYDSRIQSPAERYYDSWIGVVHSEVAFRSGNVELSRSKFGRLLESYAVMSAPLQRLLMSNIEYFEHSMGDHALLIKEFLPLLTNQGVTMTQTLPHSLLMATTFQHMSDSKSINYSSNDVYSPSNTYGPVGSSSEEISTVAEFYDVSADPFFEFDSITL